MNFKSYLYLVYLQNLRSSQNFQRYFNLKRIVCHFLSRGTILFCKLLNLFNVTEKWNK